MTTQLVSPQFKQGDRVWYWTGCDNLSTSVPATIVSISPAGARIRFDVPNENGDLEDIVSLDSLSPTEETDRSEHPSIGFINSLFSPDDWLCVFLLYSDGRNATEFHSAAEIATERYLRALAEKNATGANLYVSMNSLQPGADRRVKELAGKPAHVFIDVDEAGETALKAVHESVSKGEIPAPSFVVRSSNDKYQFVWRVNESEFSFDKIEALNESLVSKFGADPACSDRLRVFRLPGFTNLKYSDRPLVEIIDANEGVHSLCEFKVSIGESKLAVVKPPASDEELLRTVDLFEKAAAEAKLSISPLKKWGANGYLWEVHPCPWVSEHTGQKDSGSVVILHNSGALGYTCRHGHCVGKTWEKFRAWLEGAVGHTLSFGMRKDSGVLLDGKPLQTSAVDSKPRQSNVEVGPQRTGLDEPPEKVLAAEEYRSPAETLEGDLLCDLTHELTDGTFIPPQFVRADLQAWLGHVLDGRLFPPNSSYLNFSTRFYVNKLSFFPQSGKGESWERVKWAFSDLMPFRPKESLVEPGTLYRPTLVDGTAWGSGPFAVSQLADTPHCLCFLDEGSGMWLSKAPTDQKSLENLFLSLFEGQQHSTGSFKNKKYEVTTAHLSLCACFTLDSFTASFEGRGSGGSGYLSRVCLAFGSKIPTDGKAWPILENTKAKQIAEQIVGRMTHPRLTTTPEAQRLVTDYKASLEKGDQHFTPRVSYYFDKDLLLRALFRDGEITPDLVRRSISWAEEQLSLRKRFWPIDSLSDQGRLEFKLLAEFETTEEQLSDRQLQKCVHLGERRCKYSAQQYLWARDALVKSGQLQIVGYNKAQNPIYKRRPC